MRCASARDGRGRTGAALLRWGTRINGTCTPVLTLVTLVSEMQPLSPGARLKRLQLTRVGGMCRRVSAQTVSNGSGWFSTFLNHKRFRMGHSKPSTNHVSPPRTPLYPIWFDSGLTRIHDARRSCAHERFHLASEPLAHPTVPTLAEGW